MDRCKDLDKYCDGVLHEEGLLDFENHLKGCPDCRGAVDAWSVVKEAVNFAHGEQAKEYADADIDNLQAARLVRLAAERSQPEKIAMPRIFWASMVGGAALATVLMTVLLLGEDKILAPEEVPTAFKTEIIASPPTVLVERVTDEEITPRKILTNQDDTLTTGPSESIRFNLKGNRVGLGSEGQMRVIETGGAGTHIKLEKGLLACSVLKTTREAPFVVKTDIALVRVVGTRFLVKKRAATGLSISVEEGIVEVVKESRRWDIQPGKRLSIGLDGKVAIQNENDFIKKIAILLGETDDVFPDKAKIGGQTRDAGSGHHKNSETTDVQHLETTDNIVRRISLDNLKALVIAGELSEAQDHLNSWVHRKPQDGEAWSLLADCRRKQGDWDGAVKAYERVITLLPANVANRGLYRGAILLQDKLNKPEKVAQWLTRYLSTKPASPTLEHRARVRLARALILVGRQNEAQTHLQLVIEENADSASFENAKKLLESLD